MAHSEEEIDEEVTLRVRPSVMTHQQSTYPKENDVETDSECLRASKILIREKRVQIERRVIKEVKNSLQGKVQVTQRQLQKWKFALES